MAKLTDQNQNRFKMLFPFAEEGDRNSTQKAQHSSGSPDEEGKYDMNMLQSFILHRNDTPGFL